MGDQLSIFDYMRQPVKVDKPIRLIELFAGYGSQAMALKRLGADFETYKVVEFDKYAIASYNAVHGTNFLTIDINNVKGEDLQICDKQDYTYLLTYSFPCTDISVAGRMEGMAEDSGTRSALLWQVGRILRELAAADSLPDIMLMENVPAIHSDKNKPHFQKWLDFLQKIGYSTYVQDLNACDFGIAQNRVRTFAISFLGEVNYKFPDPMELYYSLEDYFEDLTEEQALKQVVKSEKALNLIIRLDDEGKLE